MKGRNRKANVVSSRLMQAVDLHQHGEFDKAEAIYRNILKQDPRHADALNLLGLICYQKKNYNDALRLIQKAIDRQNNNLDYFNNLGTVLKDMQRWEESQTAYFNALFIQPDNADVHYNLGGLYLLMEDADQAANYYKRAIDLKNDYFQAYANLSSIYNERGEFKLTIECCKRALDFGAKNAAILNNLGNALIAVGQLGQAEAAFKASIALEPQSSATYSNLGNVLSASERFQQAIACYRKAIELDSNNFKAFTQLGNVLRKSGHLLESMRCYQTTIRLQPKDAVAYHNVATILKDMDNMQAAARYYKMALEIDPEKVETLIGMGAVYTELGKRADAQNCFLKAIDLRPDYALPYCHLISSYQYECHWAGIKRYGPLLDSLTGQALDSGQVPHEEPFLHCIRHADPLQNYRIAKAKSDRLFGQLAEIRNKLQFQRSQIKQGRRKLNIAYLSNNFKNHPTAHLTAGLFPLHDRDRFKVFCYSYGKTDRSKYRRDIENGCDRFVDIEKMDHFSVAEQMIRDEIDILVDMVGFIKNNRMGIAALRPAPVQIRWLGMAGTSGANFYDYIITDEIVTPRDQTPHYSETFCYMPHTYQINSTIQNEPIDRLSKKEAGLPDTGFVFCSFCTTYKIDETIFNAWMRILSEAPGSVLWMLTPSERAVEEIQTHALRCGVDPNRIVFAAKIDRKTHLDRLGCADLGLDTMIVNGAATTSEALWCGVPVLTIQGDHFASRMTSSILNAIELPELVVHSLDDYVRTAVDAANNPSYIDHLKYKVAAKKKTAPLFDRQRFVKNLEKRYEQIWRCHETGAAKTIVDGRDEE